MKTRHILSVVVFCWCFTFGLTFASELAYQKPRAVMIPDNVEMEEYITDENIDGVLIKHNTFIETPKKPCSSGIYTTVESDRRWTSIYRCVDGIYQYQEITETISNGAVVYNFPLPPDDSVFKEMCAKYPDRFVYTYEGDAVAYGKSFRFSDTMDILKMCGGTLTRLTFK